MEVEIKVGQRRANCGARGRAQFKRRQQRSTRERLRVTDVEEEIESDRRACKAIRRGGAKAKGSSHSNAAIPTPSKRKPPCNTSEVMARTSKRYKPGD